MSFNVEKEVAELQRMTVAQLRERYAEVFGDETKTGNKAWLIKRIAWRMQANAEGGLSERARQRAAEIANEADIRMTPPRPKQVAAMPERRTVSAPLQINGDRRLPMPGAIITRDYKGRKILVRVLSNGFDFEGEVYKSLSAVAKAITGSHTNGFYFFRLQGDQR